MKVTTALNAESRDSQPSATLAHRLENEPYGFDFFQAVRLLRLLSRQSASTGDAPLPRAVGYDHAPREEVVRFRALASHRFPAAVIHSLKPAGPPTQHPSPSVPEMVVSFMGLTGPSGVLPRHYTQLLIDRVRHKDHALRDFLDLFHHRIISLFYRAWEKYHFPIAYEEAAGRPDRREEDLFTRCLYCLVGLGTGGLRNRLRLRDETFVYYGGLFAHFPRNAISLEALVTDYFQVQALVIQFYGQWLYLAPHDQTCLPSRGHHDGMNSQLGMSAVVGQRVWGVENKFRLRLGPLGYVPFRGFTPMGDQLITLGQLVRTYVGPEFDFDIQPVLRKDEVPCARLDADGPDPSRLGWNTWIRTVAMPADAGDAVFESEGGPV